jgi:protein-tyrosine phosphatase
VIRVLFVCLGNICRSPLSQGVFTDLLRREGLEDEVEVDSAGTGDYHLGEPPERRTREVAAKRDIDLGPQRARQIQHEDCEKYDYILVMDRENSEDVGLLCGQNGQAKVGFFMDYAPEADEREVPDPYFGGGFEYVMDLIEQASRGLLEDIKRRRLKERV